MLKVNKIKYCQGEIYSMNDIYNIKFNFFLHDFIKPNKKDKSEY